MTSYKQLDRKRQERRRHGCCFFRLHMCWRVLLVAAGVLVTGIATSLVVVSSMGPLHASCKVTWDVDAECDVLNSGILSAMHDMYGAKGCEKGGEKCLYTVVSNTSKTIKGKHETPKKHYVDDLTFTFETKDQGCSIKGYSTSETWYAVLDYGTNYCNLRNVILGAGINKMSKFAEHTTNSECTQYSSANCEKY